MENGIQFSAQEYGEDGGFRPAGFSYSGSETDGWSIRRNRADHLDLGPGYRLLRVQSCGVCSTDLARRFLPFRLPQVTGHEILATDAQARRCVVEINASHAARGITSDCVFCNSGLPTHCPERLVLGIHDLPGGFGPWILAPINAVMPLPDVIPDEAGVLVEPLAAALHAVDTIKPHAGDTIAVLGPRRLGMLVVAALAARRRSAAADFKILAVSRHEHLLGLARQFGADDVCHCREISERKAVELADVVIDTTGSPDGFDMALQLARREVHLKSTHGQAAGGVAHLTEFVVDELRLERLQATAPERRTELPRPAEAVVGDADEFSRTVRPSRDREEAAIMPRGRILLRGDAEVGQSSLLRAVRDRGLVLSSSRCGDFQAAIDLLASDSDLRRIGSRLVTHRFSAADMNEVFRVAGARECIKAVVEH